MKRHIVNAWTEKLKDGCCRLALLLSDCTVWREYITRDGKSTGKFSQVHITGIEGLDYGEYSERVRIENYGSPAEIVITNSPLVTQELPIMETVLVTDKSNEQETR